FPAQVTSLTLIAFYIAQVTEQMDAATLKELVTELDRIPEPIKECLATEEAAKYIASEIKDTSSCLYPGSGIGLPLALEGALKLKEISYIHAEGYPAAEMKHGPIALIEEGFPVIVIATKSNSYEKVVSNIQEVKA